MKIKPLNLSKGELDFLERTLNALLDKMGSEPAWQAKPLVEPVREKIRRAQGH